jgi:hypothetical protein
MAAKGRDGGLRLDCRQPDGQLQGCQLPEIISAPPPAQEIQFGMHGRDPELKDHRAGDGAGSRPVRRGVVKANPARG